MWRVWSRGSVLLSSSRTGWGWGSEVGEEEKEDGGGERKKSEMKPCFNMVDTCCLDLVSSNNAIDVFYEDL